MSFQDHQSQQSAMSMHQVCVLIFQDLALGQGCQGQWSADVVNLSQAEVPLGRRHEGLIMGNGSVMYMNGFVRFLCTIWQYYPKLARIRNGQVIPKISIVSQ